MTPAQRAKNAFLDYGISIEMQEKVKDALVRVYNYSPEAAHLLVDNVLSHMKKSFPRMFNPPSQFGRTVKYY